MRQTGFERPLTREEVCTTQYYSNFAARPLTAPEFETAHAGARMLWSGDPDPLLDLGPQPRKRAGRKTHVSIGDES